MEEDRLVLARMSGLRSPSQPNCPGKRRDGIPRASGMRIVALGRDMDLAKAGSGAQQKKSGREQETGQVPAKSRTMNDGE